MIQYHTITSHDCLVEQCGTTGCKRFICWEITSLVKDSNNTLTHIMVFDKERQMVMIHLSLTPLKLSEAFSEPDQANPMFITRDNDTHAYVSLRWVLSQNPPPKVAEQLKHLDEMIMEQVSEKIPSEGKIYLYRKHVCPGSNSLN